jgi:ABC-type multidrug transport system fused ATPase/permease subunit
MPSFSPLEITKFALNLLPKRDRRLLVTASLFQVGLSLLDLAGVALIGILGSLSVNGVQSKKPGERVNFVLEQLHLEGSTLQTQVAVIGSLAAGILISRTLMSAYFSRRTMFFLSKRGANISSQLVSKLLNQSYLQINTRSIQETIYSIMSGVSVLTLTVLGGVVSLITDLSLLVVLLAGLFVVDHQLAIGTFLLFGGIVLALYFLLHKKVHRLGKVQAVLNIGINEKISEVITSYRENIVRGRRPYYVKIISEDQSTLASAQAEISFMPSISKYVVEVSLVLGTLLVCAVQFKSHDATQAVGTLLIFLTAGSRIAPATLRIQQAALALRNASGVAFPTMELIESLTKTPESPKEIIEANFSHQNFDPTIRLSKVAFSYPHSEKMALQEVTLDVQRGETIAFVGPSGAGKTTLVDTILGVLKPTTGQIEISGLHPHEAIKSFPGAVAYVPQDVVILNRTFIENIAIGYDISEVNMEYVMRAIDVAHLTELVESLPLGLNSMVGERGIKISGGQRQRLGIARALYTNPKLLVLDEATSALDGQTEADISYSIQQLRGNTTVILIAHRLSTVMHADRVYYLDEGKITASGTFSDVRKQIPNFDAQANLMGLHE